MCEYISAEQHCASILKGRRLEVYRLDVLISHNGYYLSDVWDENENVVWLQSEPINLNYLNSSSEKIKYILSIKSFVMDALYEKEPTKGTSTRI